jgi:hypothetical protein
MQINDLVRAAVIELYGVRCMRRQQIVLARPNMPEPDMAGHRKQCPLYNVDFEPSTSHSQCPEVSQNAHFTLVFEMSRHSASGETFQRQA